MKYKEKISKCVCSDYNKLGWYRYLTHLNKPREDENYNFENWTQFGLPIIKIVNNHQKCIEVVAECPVCGRGGIFEQKSLYSAIKSWNELQESLHKPNCPFVNDTNNGDVSIGHFHSEVEE